MGVASGAVLFSFNMGGLCSSMGHGFFLDGRQSPVLWLQTPQSGGHVGQDSGDGSLKTKARVRVRS